MSTAGVLFLDRDGVLNEKPAEGSYLLRPDDLRLIPGVGDALVKLRADVPGLRIAVVTNQRGVALGLLDQKTLEAIHAHLREALAATGAWLDRIEVCPHEKGICSCRKPESGLLERLLAAWPDADRSRSAMVGDSASDVIAGWRAGVRTFLVGGSAARERQSALARASGAMPDAESGSLAALAADGSLSSWLRAGRAASRPVPT